MVGRLSVGAEGSREALSGRSIQLSGGELKVRSFCSRAHTNKLKTDQFLFSLCSVRLVTQLDELVSNV